MTLAVRGVAAGVALLGAGAAVSFAPGYRAGCLSVSLPGGGGYTDLVPGRDGCVELVDSPSAATWTRFSGFGEEPASRDLQARILAANGSGPTAQTIVWLGSLTCTDSAQNPVCRGGLGHESEREQLQALLAAQVAAAASGTPLRIVLANAGQDMRDVEKVADLLVRRHRSSGDPLVVVGGGDSRIATQNAINTLLDAGIPVIAPTLTADQGNGEPDGSLVEGPGYLQRAPSNTDYAEDIVTTAGQALPGVPLVVYRTDQADQAGSGDLYVRSLVGDLLTVGLDRRQDVRVIGTLSAIDTSICTASSRPSPLVFADRWTRFPDFVAAVTRTCGKHGPRLVIADSSVDRVMNHDDERLRLSGDWGLRYYAVGAQCDKLTNGNPSAATLLDALRRVPSLQQACSPTQVGAHVAPTWDAVQLARKLLTNGWRSLSDLRADHQGSQVDGEGAVVTFTVRGGKLVGRANPPRPLCVPRLNDASPRSLNACQDLLSGRS